MIRARFNNANNFIDGQSSRKLRISDYLLLVCFTGVFFTNTAFIRTSNAPVLDSFLYLIRGSLFVFGAYFMWPIVVWTLVSRISSSKLYLIIVYTPMFSLCYNVLDNFQKFLICSLFLLIIYIFSSKIYVFCVFFLSGFFLVSKICGIFTVKMILT